MKVGRENYKLALLGIFFLATVFVWGAVLRSEEQILKIIFFDIGQGDSIFIQSPNGNQMLVDGGSNSGVLQKLGGVMSFYDRTIDVVVGTHPDKDHIGGLPDVFRHYKVENVLRSGATNDTGIFNELNAVIEKEGTRDVLARRGMVIDFGDGAYGEILFPDHDVRNVDPNDASIIMRVVYGDTEVMLTGDAPQKIEKYLASLDGEYLQSDILKAGHHGSKTSSSAVFLGFVAPEYAVISAGKDNSYGHPHKEVLDLLAQFGIPILSTNGGGDVVFESNGETLVLKN